MALTPSTLLHISHPIKSMMLVALLILALMPITHSLAQPINYGPIKSGDTLWKIAKANLSDQSISIEQFVYAIYATNPKEFQAGNINQLLKGGMLKMPTSDSIKMTTKPEAKKLISILQADAQQISRAKVKSRRFNQQIKKHGRQLRKHRRNSKAWKRIYRKLARSKRNLTISNRKVAHLHKLLRDKAVIKPNTPLKKEIKEKSNTEANKNMASNNAKEPKKITEISQQEVDETNKILAKTETEETPKKQIIPEEKMQKSPLKQIATATIQEVNSTNNTARSHTDQLKLNKGKQSEQQKAQVPTSPSKQSKNWLAFLDKNLIIIGGVINAIILLFVLFKLFEKKEEPDFIN